MLSNRKRKLAEYHDPDYPQDVHVIFESSAKAENKSETSTSKPPQPFSGAGTTHRPIVLSSEEKEQKIRDIITREFDREIAFKEQQLEEIDNRLTKAKELLHQIRYAVVSEYYNKQNIQHTDSEAAAIRGRTLFSSEPNGPQIPLHPSLKKIIGKKPKSIEEIFRACPKREAAKTAKTTIKEKSRSNKEEKRIQRMIKERGIVIDHSKQQPEDNENLMRAPMSHDSPMLKVPRHVEPRSIDKPISKLNAPRLNNQTKHLIVVGNTSKYVGDEKSSDMSSHKWLVYVQAKTAIPIENFVTKARFFLHSSYRPNDVVDIDSAPFQLARRGWGEFPVRIQLFFDARLQQKPVQLVHNLVLDKTLSGLQTMGAETLVEIWLRTDPIIPQETLTKPLSSASVVQTISVIPPAMPEVTPTVASLNSHQAMFSPNSVTKPQTLLKNEIISPKAEIDDNLFDFLDKIETPAICADIEKIQPTIMDSPIVDRNLFGSCKALGTPPISTITKLREQLEETSVYQAPHSLTSIAKLVIPSISKGIIIKSSPIVEQENSHIQQPGKKHQSEKVDSGNSESQEETSTLKKEKILPTSTSHLKLSHFTSQTTTASLVTPCSVFTATTKNPASAVSTIAQSLKFTNSQMIGLPVSSTEKVTTLSTTTAKNTSAPTIKGQTPKILQKKLVQFIDKQGNVKYLQMLVAAPGSNAAVSTKASSCINLSTNTVTSTHAAMVTKLSVPHVERKIENPNRVNGSAATTIFSQNLFKQTRDMSQVNNETATLDNVLGSTSTPGTPLTNGNSSVQQIQIKSNPVIHSKNSLHSSIPGVLLNGVSYPQHKNQIFHKEGKVYIIDPLQSKLRQQRKKQVSLLKPQISLLKPQLEAVPSTHFPKIQAKVSQAIASDHDYTMNRDMLGDLNKRTPLVRCHTISNSLISHTQARQLSTVIAPSETYAPCKASPMPVRMCIGRPTIVGANKKPRREYRREMELKFRSSKFSNVRTAVEFLLRRLPLVSLLARENEYRTSYPFVVATWLEFSKLIPLKQKALEWLRAKYILKLIATHSCFHKIPDNPLLWTTREIVIFGRLHAYTPVIDCLDNGTNNSDRIVSSTELLSDLVKSEIRRELKLHFQTITTNHRISNWADSAWKLVNNYYDEHDKEIVVDICDGDKRDFDSPDKKLKIISPIKSNVGKMWLPMQDSLENEANLVQSICQDTGIRLQPEEILQDVIHPTAQTVLAQTIRLFIEDLVRSSIAMKIRGSLPAGRYSNGSKPGNACGSSNNGFGEMTIEPNDIRNAINSRVELDFLSNKNFGTIKSNDLMELG